MKLSPNFRASLYVIGFMLYLVVAIFGFESAKAEVPIAQKQLQISTCAAALWVVSEGIKKQPSLSEIFRQESVKFTIYWEQEWPDMDWKPFVLSQYQLFVADLKANRVRWADVVVHAKVCITGWEKISEQT